MLTCQQTKTQLHVDYSQLHNQLLKNNSHSKLGPVQSSNWFTTVRKLSMKVSHKSKVHRTQLSLKNSVVFWKLHSRFFEFINTLSAYDSTCLQTFTFLNYFKRTHAFTRTQFRCTHAFKRRQFRFIPNAFKRSLLTPELFNVIKTCPKSAPGFASMYKYSWPP